MERRPYSAHGSLIDRFTLTTQTAQPFLCRSFVPHTSKISRTIPGKKAVTWYALWPQVSNHTSMIDYIILTAYSPFAVIMQLHGGWIRFLQTQVLQCLGCLWFNRTEVRPNAPCGPSISGLAMRKRMFFARIFHSRSPEGLWPIDAVKHGLGSGFPSTETAVHALTNVFQIAITGVLCP